MGLRTDLGAFAAPGALDPRSRADRGRGDREAGVRARRERARRQPARRRHRDDPERRSRTDFRECRRRPHPERRPRHRPVDVFGGRRDGDRHDRHHPTGTQVEPVADEGQLTRPQVSAPTSCGARVWPLRSLAGRRTAGRPPPCTRLAARSRQTAGRRGDRRGRASRRNRRPTAGRSVRTAGRRRRARRAGV